MEKYIKYKRFNETHDENTINTFFDKLITEGWEIIYYNEIRQSTGVLAPPQQTMIHVVVVAGKKQNDVI